MKVTSYLLGTTFPLASRQTSEDTLEKDAKDVRRRSQGCGPFTIKITSRGAPDRFWTPRGVDADEYVWGRPGAPRRLSGGKKVSVYLDTPTIDRVTEIGGGNFSLGIRRAIRRAT